MVMFHERSVLSCDFLAGDGGLACFDGVEEGQIRGGLSSDLSLQILRLREEVARVRGRGIPLVRRHQTQVFTEKLELWFC